MMRFLSDCETDGAMPYPEDIDSLMDGDWPAAKVNAVLTKLHARGDIRLWRGPRGGSYDGEMIIGLPSGADRIRTAHAPRLVSV